MTRAAESSLVFVWLASSYSSSQRAAQITRMTSGKFRVWRGRGFTFNLVNNNTLVGTIGSDNLAIERLGEEGRIGRGDGGGGGEEGEGSECGSESSCEGGTPEAVLKITAHAGTHSLALGTIKGNGPANVIGKGTYTGDPVPPSLIGSGTYSLQINNTKVILQLYNQIGILEFTFNGVGENAGLNGIWMGRWE